MDPTPIEAGMPKANVWYGSNLHIIHNSKIICNTQGIVSKQ